MTVSEEGGLQKCLNIVPGRVIRLPEGLKVPHMGWNQVELGRSHRVATGPWWAVFLFRPLLLRGAGRLVNCGRLDDYGVRFPAIVAKDNLIATQFHPEKSGEIGLSIYAGFIEWASNFSR